MNKETPKWITDISLRFRLEKAILIMLRGEHTLRERVKLASSHLVPLLIRDFPEEYHKAAEIILSLRLKNRDPDPLLDRWFHWKPYKPSIKDIQLWIEALFTLYSYLLLDIGAERGSTA